METSLSYGIRLQRLLTGVVWVLRRPPHRGYPVRNWPGESPGSLCEKSRVWIKFILQIRDIARGDSSIGDLPFGLRIILIRHSFPKLWRIIKINYTSLLWEPETSNTNISEQYSGSYRTFRNIAVILYLIPLLDPLDLQYFRVILCSWQTYRPRPFWRGARGNPDFKNKWELDMILHRSWLKSEAMCALKCLKSPDSLTLQNYRGSCLSSLVNLFYSES